MRARVNICLAIIILFCLTAGSWAAESRTSSEPLVYTVNINGTVTEGTRQYINRTFKTAEANGAQALVILINTPGGLVASTLDIIQTMSASPVPVITYVNPQGGIAASAGTFIMLNGHIAAMTPGTTCGAAMPVSISVPGQSVQAADQKTINFLAGHMKTIARERGRPGDIAQKFVTENLTLSYQEALDMNIIDAVADNLPELLEKVHGMQALTAAGPVQLNTAGAKISSLAPGTSEKIASLIGNPTLAMILLLLGIYGLIIGFSSPGFFLPEVVGALGLILGLYGLGLFEINLTAVLLMVLGLILLVAEAFTPTYGILGLGGILSLVLGMLFLPVEPMMPRGWFGQFTIMVIGVGVIGAVFISAILVGIIRLRRTKPLQGEGEFVNQVGIAINTLEPFGQVKIKGEIWNALLKKGGSIPGGEKVKVVARQGLTLLVEPVDGDNKEK